MQAIMRTMVDGGDRQRSCDVIQAKFRPEATGRRSIRRDPPPKPAALIPTDDPLKLRMAEELEYARRILDLMGDELSSDPAIIARHIRALQSFDIVGQILGHIANLVRSSDPQGAIELIGMAELKARLSRKSVV